MSHARYVLVKGREGLGSRLLAAATGLLYAQLTDRVPIIDWRDPTYSDGRFNAFAHFFDCPACAGIEDIPRSASAAPQIWCGHLDESQAKLHRSFIGDQRAWQIRSSLDLARDYSEDVVVMWWYYGQVDALRPRFCGEFERLAGRPSEGILGHLLIHELTLNPEIAERVEDFRSRFLTAGTVGVHVRYSDRRGDLDATHAALDRLLRARPGKPIFLATDNIEVKQSFDAYPNVVSTPHWYAPPGEHLHQSRHCQDRLENGVEALVDLFLLAGCEYLIGDARSSFFRVAALLSCLPDSNVVGV